MTRKRLSGNDLLDFIGVDEKTPVWIGLDVHNLAEYAAKGMIEAITTPTEQESAERSVLRRRNQFVDSTRKTKQRIKFFLLFHGIEEEYGLRYWNQSAKSKPSKLPLQSDLKFVLKSLLRQLSYEEQELAKITNRLARITKRRPHWEVVKKRYNPKGNYRPGQAIGRDPVAA